MARDMASILNEYRPKKWREKHTETDRAPHRTYDDITNSIDEGPTGYPIEGDKIDRGHNNKPGLSRLDEIAEALRTLTYGQMLELAESMWRVNPQGSGVTESDLPNILYRWSKSRSASRKPRTAPSASTAPMTVSLCSAP
jgi:hypothetical protein